MNRFALIIEDDPTLGKIYSTALKGAEFDSLLDADGNLYPGIIERRLPDIIFLDLQLPYASGVDILKDLRAHPEWKDIPVVVLTADIVHAKDAQSLADRVLIKPVSVTRIQELARQLADS